MPTYVPFGYATAQGETARSRYAAATLEACRASRTFELLELRRWQRDTADECDVIVVDCVNDQVPSRNTVGIKVRERLALVFPLDERRVPQVRALRDAFPRVMHTNLVPAGEPRSLCIYFEPWSAIRRTWTPEKFLQRICWWLKETAAGTLHRADQPVEPLYLESPIELLLPPAIQNQIGDASLALAAERLTRDDGRMTVRTRFAARADIDRQAAPQLVPIYVAPPPVTHGLLETFPSTLGALEDHFVAHGSSLTAAIVAALRATVGSRGVPSVVGQACLLILAISIRRAAGSAIERTDTTYGFQLDVDLATLGVQTGALAEVPINGRYFATQLLGGAEPTTTTAWRGIKVVPVSVRQFPTKDFARKASGVTGTGAVEQRVLAGAGALGGSLADRWAREGWGEWSVVDFDHVEAHNPVRGVAKAVHAGFDKVQVVKAIAEDNYYPGLNTVAAIRADILDTSHAMLTKALSTSTLLVDATATLEVPRELAFRTDVPRCVSAFLTPNGLSSVLLMEDASRDVRLDALEAQYYSAILRDGWGSQHLIGHTGDMWVGAGCRDVSFVIADELVQLHAAILARQIRLRSAETAARICVWVADADSSAVQSVHVDVATPVRAKAGDWSIVSNAQIEQKLRTMRMEHLPAETGGVVIGYVDHSSRSLYVVNVLPQPPDSKGDENGFVRGVEGVREAIDEIERRTARIVRYVGEWHSHPPFYPPFPSTDDKTLLRYCAEALAADGEPALMIIVGRAGEVSYSIGSVSAAPASASPPERVVS